MVASKTALKFLLNFKITLRRVPAVKLVVVERRFVSRWKFHYQSGLLFAVAIIIIYLLVIEITIRFNSNVNFTRTF